MFVSTGGGNPFKLEYSKVVTPYFYSHDWASGGLVSTAAELGNFWMALMNA